MKKSKLFAKASESLIDQAEQANQNADSIDPQAQQSAVDFDAELRRLNGEEQASPPDTGVGDGTGAPDTGTGDAATGDLDMGGSGGSDPGMDLGSGDLGAAAATDGAAGDAPAPTGGYATPSEETEGDATPAADAAPAANTPATEPAADDAPAAPASTDTEGAGEPAAAPADAPAATPPAEPAADDTPAAPEGTQEGDAAPAEGEQAPAADAPEKTEPAAEPAATEEPAAEPPKEEESKETPDAPETPADGEDKPAEEPSGEGDEEDADPAEATEPLPEEGDLRKAAEGISRLVRCLQSIEEAHECGMVSPVVATVAHGEADAVIADMGLDVEGMARPATEAIARATESGRFEEVRTRLKATIAAAWKKFLEWVSKIQRWTQEFRRGYNAKRGIYEKTAAGYAARAKALQQSPRAGELKHSFEANINPLATETRLEGVDALVEGGNILSAVSLATAKACFNVNIMPNLGSIVQVFKGLATGPEADAMDAFKGLDMAGALNATQSSDLISVTHPSLSHEYGPPAVNAAGYLRVGKIPGNLTLNWSLGDSEHFQSIAEAVRATAQNNFTLGRGDKTDTDAANMIEIDLAGVEKLLALYGAMAKSSAELLRVLSAVERALALATKHSVDITKIVVEGNRAASDAGDPSLSSGRIQDLVRLYTMLTSAYERCAATPVHALVRAQNAGQEMVLRHVGVALTGMDQQMKAAAAV